MRRVGIGLLTLALALGCGTGGTGGSGGATGAPTPSGGENHARHLDAPYVILWSFDGFRADYLDWYPTPNFDRVAREGLRADGLVPVFPSMTFPNHYSIATGLHPQNHGLVANEFYDPDRDAWYDYHEPSTVIDGSWYGGEPIWVTAEKQGMVAASYFFVGTEADIQGIRPTITKTFDSRVPNAARVDSVLAWLDLPDDRRPHMLTLYISTVDGAGHDHGPAAPETRQAVAHADSLLGHMLRGLERSPVGERTYLVLVADHGMAEVHSDRVEYLEDHLDPDELVISAVSAYASLFVPAGPERAVELRDRLNQGMRHGRAYLKRDLPEELQFSRGPRVGDIVVLMDQGWRVYADRESGPREGPGGQHGYVPSLRSSHALFIAKGPTLERGRRIPAFQNIHIYPWLAGLLGLEAAEMDGDPEVLGRFGR